MLETTDTAAKTDIEIARHDVSEDGVTWRPYDPARDEGAQLHTRIVFADLPPDRN